MLGEIIDLQVLGDSRGGLVVAEAQKHIPFDIKRMYWIHGTQQEVERGFHAHKAHRQAAVAVSGACDMILDNGANAVTVSLDSPAQAILIEPGVWHYMNNFTTDCVLLVFADAHYEEADYIRDYNEFIRLKHREA